MQILSPKILSELCYFLGARSWIFFSFFNSINPRRPPGYVQECDIEWDYATVFATNYPWSCLDEVELILIKGKTRNLAVLVHAFVVCGFWVTIYKI